MSHYWVTVGLLTEEGWGEFFAVSALKKKLCDDQNKINSNMLWPLCRPSDPRSLDNVYTVLLKDDGLNLGFLEQSPKLYWL